MYALWSKMVNISRKRSAQFAHSIPHGRLKHEEEEIKVDQDCTESYLKIPPSAKEEVCYSASAFPLPLESKDTTSFFPQVSLLYPNFSFFGVIWKICKVAWFLIL